jgi:hypothetical protein
VRLGEVKHVRYRGVFPRGGAGLVRVRSRTILGREGGYPRHRRRSQLLSPRLASLHALSNLCKGGTSRPGGRGLDGHPARHYDAQNPTSTGRESVLISQPPLASVVTLFQFQIINVSHQLLISHSFQPSRAPEPRRSWSPRSVHSHNRHIHYSNVRSRQGRK